MPVTTPWKTAKCAKQPLLRAKTSTGCWRCAHIKEDCSIIYLRPWTYSPHFVASLPNDPKTCFKEKKADKNAAKVKPVRAVLSQPCHRCMAENFIGSHLCASCYLPIFYEKVLPARKGAKGAEWYTAWSCRVTIGQAL